MRLTEYRDELIEKILTAARARISPVAAAEHSGRWKQSYSASVIVPRLVPMDFASGDRLIAVGASTGGTEAIRELLTGLPPDAPGVVIAQHIPRAFSKPF